MQTTLLSLAIALILALLAALVGPHVIRWNDHRAFFEAEASRLVGVKVLVGGDIDATLLPSPSVTLRAIAIGPAGSGSRLRARSLKIDLSLGPLLRGDLRATEMRLVAPQFNLGLDGKGQIDWPRLSLADDTLSIDRLQVEDGHATITDALSKTRLELDQLRFTGDVRSLTGPIRGRGSFVTGGSAYGYDISASRGGPDGTRVKLSIKTDERPLTFEAEGLMAFDNGTPRFDGAVTLSRLAGAVLTGGKAESFEPWQLTSKVKANPSLAILNEISFQYGPEDRAVTLAGSGEFKFGASPQMSAALAARQVDLDRLLATPQFPRRPPLAAIQAFGEMLSGALRPSWPVKLALNVDAVTLGGASVQNVASELSSDGRTWTVNRMELRAPGFTQVKIDGRLYPLGKGLGFTGGTSVDSNDPKNLVAWLAGHATTGTQYKPWRAKGDVTLRSDRFAVEHLRTEIDRGVVEGSLAYTWPSGDRPARLAGELSAGDLDLDGMISFGESAFSGMGLERPGEITLAVDIGRARIADFDARNVAAKLKLDSSGLAIERLSVGDLGNTSFVATGHVRTQDNPGGNITVNLDSRDLSGILAVADKFTPALAAPLRRLAARQKTATLQAVVGLESSGPADAHGKIALTGRIGAIRVNVSASATGRRSSFVFNDLGGLAGTDARIDGQLDSDESGPLLGLLGLDAAVGSERKPAHLSVVASGPLGRELDFEGKLDAGPIDAGGKGTLKLAAGRAPVLAMHSFAGSIGSSKVSGRWTLGLGDTPSIDGSIEADTLDASSVIAAAVGMPVQRMAGGTAWSSDPIGWSSNGLSGRIAFKTPRAVLTSWLSADDLTGVVSFNGPEVVFDNVAAKLGRGRLEGRLALSSAGDGLSARLHVGLNGAEVGAVFTGLDHPGTAGQMSLEADLQGSGRSPAAFVGSLAGSGTVTLEKARLAGLNPQVFGAVMRARELGIPTDGSRLREFVTGALDSAGLPVPRARAAIDINAGQARLRNVTISTDGADLQANVNVDLSEATLDALLTLNGNAASPGGPQPAVLVILKGKLPQPKRAIDTGLLTNWLTLRDVELHAKQVDAMEKAARERQDREKAEREKAEKAERERIEREKAAAAAASAAAAGDPPSQPPGNTATEPPISTSPASPDRSSQSPPLPAPAPVKPRPRVAPRPAPQPSAPVFPPPLQGVQ